MSITFIVLITIIAIAGRPVVSTITTTGGKDQQPQLLFSRFADRRDAAALQGAVLSRARFIFVSAPGQLERVTFYLDGAPVQDDRSAPFDLADTRADGSARALDTTKLTPGTHTFSARIVLRTKHRDVRMLVARASVANGTSSGPIATGPTPVGTSPGQGPDPGPNPTGTSGSGPIVGNTIKATATGLIDRKGPPPLSMAPIVNTFVVNASWASLQAYPDAPITANNPIDRAIAWARARNAAGAQMRIKIRYVGTQPAWVQHLGGAPISMHDPVDGHSVSVGRFWTDQFGAAYDQLQAKMAARYDSVPEVVDVTIARCTTVYAETFIRQIADKASRTALLNAGYTAALDARCMQQQISAHLVWHHTRSSLAANPMQTLAADGVVSSSVPMTIRVLADCRRVLGSRCVLENNSAGSRYLTGDGQYQQMYAGMFALGGPITLQTQVPSKVGNLADVLSWAAAHGVTAVELPAGYESMVSSSQLKTFSQRFSTNAVRLSQL